MKINMPITDEEHILLESDSIVSKSDLFGVITYVNADFIRISGYTEQELIGMPSSILRHPDMPIEVFKDMWQCLQAGQPWSGLVKNRRKNGDFYWVVARMTPYYENDTLVGYMSVRTLAEVEQIAKVSTAYAQLRAGKAGKLKIEKGKIVKPAFLEKFNFFKNLSIANQLTIIVASMLVLVLSVGSIGIFGIIKANTGLQDVYEHHMEPSTHLAIIQNMQVSSQLRLTVSLLTPTTEGVLKTIGSVEQHIATINQHMSQLLVTAYKSKDKTQIEQLVKNQQRYMTEGLEPTLDALRRNDLVLANSLVLNKITPLYQPLEESIQILMQIEQNEALLEYMKAQFRFNRILIALLGLFIASLFGLLWLRQYLTCIIIVPLHKINEYFSQIAQGNYKSKIKIGCRNEIGKALEGLKSMQIKLGFDVDQIKHISADNLRFKIALDSACCGVMVADTAYNSIYFNKAAAKLIDKLSVNKCKMVPDLSVANLLGMNMDSFLKNTVTQAHLPSSLIDTYESEIVLGNSIILVKFNQMLDSQGARIGMVIEFYDRTNEIIAINELTDIVAAAVRGYLGKRMDVQDKSGFIRDLSLGINSLLNISEQIFTDITQIQKALSVGDLTKRITTDYSGSFEHLKDDANSTVDSLSRLIHQIHHVADSMSTAAKETANANHNLSYRTQQQTSSLDRTSKSMERLALTVQQNAKNAKNASQIADETSTIASNGVKVVNQVVNTMADISEASHKIIGIISMIDSIAFQTKILALNAVVEAARAGEQGRGFAVVATEVLNLAKLAASSAGDIKQLIHDSVEKVDDGSRLVAESGKNMEEMVNAISGMTFVIREISKASAEQSFSIEQIHLAMAQIDEVTQQNAVLIENGTEATDLLQHQAITLSNMLNVFTLNDDPAIFPAHPQEITQEIINEARLNASQDPLMTKQWATNLRRDKKF